MGQLALQPGGQPCLSVAITWAPDAISRLGLPRVITSISPQKQTPKRKIVLGLLKTTFNCLFRSALSLIRMAKYTGRFASVPRSAYVGML